MVVVVVVVVLLFIYLFNTWIVEFLLCMNQQVDSIIQMMHSSEYDIQI